MPKMLSSLLLFASLSPVLGAVTKGSLLELFTHDSPLRFVNPSPRDGFNASTAYQACGGIAATGMRGTLPLSGGYIELRSMTNLADVSFAWEAGNGSTIKLLGNSFGHKILNLSPGTIYVPTPDFGALGQSANTNITLSLTYELYGEPDSGYYQCADIILSSSATSSDGKNTSAIITLDTTGMVKGVETSGQSADMFALAASTSSSASSSTSPSTAKHSGLSAAAGGGIGAAVTLCVIAAVLALASFLGLVAFGRRTIRIRHSGYADDQTSISSNVPLTKMNRLH